MDTRQRIDRYRIDFMAFAEDLLIPTADGPARFGEVMGDFQREAFKALLPSLHAVRDHKKPPIRRFWWERTKGASKDTDVAVALLWLLLFAMRLRPLLCQAAAGDRDQAAEVRKVINDILRMNPWLAGAVEVQNWQIISKLGSKAVVEILAADAPTAHGGRPDILLCSELSHISSQDFVETLFDNVTKMPHGIAIIATNAGFADSWQWTWRELARTSDRWLFDKFDEPAPWLDPDDIAEAEKRNSSTRFARLYHGVWASGGGDALTEEDIAAAFDADLRPQTHATSGFEYCAGVDLGVSRDASAVCVLGVRRGRYEHGRIRLAATRIWRPTKGRKVNLQEVEDTLWELHQRFNFRQLCYDPWQATHMASRLQSAGLGRLVRAGDRRTALPMVEVTSTGQNLQRIASAVLEAFADRRLELYEDANLKRDLHRLRVVERSYGFRLESPHDELGHGDMGTAFGLAMLAAGELAAKAPRRVAQVF